MRFFGKRAAPALTPTQDPNQETGAPEAALLPRHVAIIMDGNGRWAKAKGQPRAFGHRAGTEALRGIIRESSDLGIEALSLYAFSTENWLRPTEEIHALMGLILEFFAKEIDELDAKGVCIRILGDVDAMPEPQRTTLCEAMRRTAANTGLALNIALNYGARAELVRAAQSLARRAASGELLPENIDEACLSSALYTAGLPDVDLLIRTSGEMRLSNFLLYQVAYAELVFMDLFWPDFNPARYHEALWVFAKRNRRFGALPKESSPNKGG